MEEENQTSDVNVVALQYNLEEVGKLREKQRELSEKIRTAREEFEEQHKEEIQVAMQAGQETMEAEQKLREIALSVYDSTKEKQLYGGIVIKVMKVLKYEEKDAMYWAKTTGLALKLDKVAFKKIAKADTPEFVTISEVPSVAIPTKIDLKPSQSEEQPEQGGKPQ